MKKKHSTLEEDILLLQQKSLNTSLSIEEISAILSHKWQFIVILILTLPFCFPLQIPGFSTPFGLLIAFFGIKMAFGKYAWLPKRILIKKIKSSTLQKITEKTLWLIGKMRGFIHPRMTWLSDYPISQVVNGILIAALGFLLALPLPIPLSNLVAAWSLFFLSVGLLEEDGVFILLGYLLSLITFAFFLATILLIKITLLNLRKI